MEDPQEGTPVCPCGRRMVLSLARVVRGPQVGEGWSWDGRAILQYDCELCGTRVEREVPPLTARGRGP